VQEQTERLARAARQRLEERDAAETMRQQAVSASAPKSAECAPSTDPDEFDPLALDNMGLD